MWHGISREDLTVYSPLLSDRLAANTRGGLRAVAEKIVEVVLDKASGSPSSERPTAKRLLLNLIDNCADKSAIINFVSYHRRLFGAGMNTATNVSMGQRTVPLINCFTGNIGDSLIFTGFGAACGPLRGEDGGLADDIDEIASDLLPSLQWCFANPEEAKLAFQERIGRSHSFAFANPFGNIINRSEFSGISSKPSLRIVTRRRQALDVADKELLEGMRNKRSMYDNAVFLPHQKLASGLV